MQTNDEKVQLDSTALYGPGINGFGRHSLGTGILLIILGAIGIALPTVMAITTVDLVGLVLLVGGGLWVWHAWRRGGGFM